MNTTTKSIAENAEKLPAEERVKLVERLLATLDKPDPDVDQAWAEVAEERLDDYLSGKTTARDAETILAKHLET